MFKPIKTKRVYAEIVDQIQQLINEGILKPGDKLISERELAEKLEVSRASIREAYSALETMGIIESRAGGGTFIRTISSEDIIKPLALILMLDKESNFDIMEVRKILELESAYLAAERANEENILKMSENLDKMEEDIRLGQIGEVSDANFHFAIAESTQNTILVRLMSTISDLVTHSMKKSREKMYFEPGNDKKLFNQHKSILEAIAAHDSSLARKKMCDHLVFVSEEIFSIEKAPSDHKKLSILKEYTCAKE